MSKIVEKPYMEYNVFELFKIEGIESSKEITAIAVKDNTLYVAATGQLFVYELRYEYDKMSEKGKFNAVEKKVSTPLNNYGRNISQLCAIPALRFLLVLVDGILRQITLESLRQLGYVRDQKDLVLKNILAFALKKEGKGYKLAVIIKNRKMAYVFNFKFKSMYFTMEYEIALADYPKSVCWCMGDYLWVGFSKEYHFINISKRKSENILRVPRPQDHCLCMSLQKEALLKLNNRSLTYDYSDGLPSRRHSIDFEEDPVLFAYLEPYLIAFFNNYIEVKLLDQKERKNKEVRVQQIGFGGVKHHSQPSYIDFDSKSLDHGIEIGYKVSASGEIQDKIYPRFRVFLASKSGVNVLCMRKYTLQLEELVEKEKKFKEALHLSKLLEDTKYQIPKERIDEIHASKELHLFLKREYKKAIIDGFWNSVRKLDEGKKGLDFQNRKDKFLEEKFIKGKMDPKKLFSIFEEEMKMIIELFLDETTFSELFKMERTKQELSDNGFVKNEILLKNLGGLGGPKGNSSFVGYFDEVGLFSWVTSWKEEDYLYFGITNGEGEEEGFGIEFFGKSRTFRYSKYFTPIYIGEFREGKRDGNGKLYETEYPKKLIFEGEFKAGKKCGRGMEYYHNRKDRYSFVIFEGIFKDNKRNGKGRLYDLEERKYIYGIWKDDELKKELKTFSCPIISYHDIKKHLTQSNQIGSGSFGIVYKVKSNILASHSLRVQNKEEYLAVKVMKQSSSYLERDLKFEMIKRGIELCSDVKDNSFFLETYGVFRSSSQIGCIMKYCKSSIDQEIIRRKGSISQDEKMEYLLGVANGMMNLHKTNTMHRDLKWGNVLLTVDNVIRITDFDTLKEDERKWNLNALTLSSKVGTPGYSAPEIHLGKKYGLPCDVFSFGIMIYSILFEQNQPFLSQYQCQKCGVEVVNILSINSLHTHVANCNFRPLLDPEKISKFPRFLIDLMILCWDKEPSKRPIFEDIFHILDSEMKKQKIKSYTLIEFKFPKHEELFKSEKLLLLMKDEKEFYGKVVFFLTTKKYEGCKIRNLDCKIGGIYENEDILNLIDKEENPIIEVSFSEITKKIQENTEESERVAILERENKRLIREVESKESINEKNEILEKKVRELKEEVEGKSNELKLVKSYFKKMKFNFDDFKKYCSFKIEETEGEEIKEEEE